MDLLAGLNLRQREAVTHGEGPLLVVAGVGTGKTTVVTRRIAWLIAEKRARPSEVLALTFTDKAATEMEERVDRLVPYGYVESEIATFHSFCDRLVRENAFLLGLAPDYRILTEAEQAIFLKERIFELPLRRFRPLGNPLHHVQALLALFSRAQDEDVSPAHYASFAAALGEENDGEALRELAAAYETYVRLLLKAGCVDFAGLIALALRLLREQPRVSASLAERFRFVLVDEFQDTNHAQFELLRALATHHNLTACGDDDQSIYGFRGAAASNLLGFRDAYPDAKTIVLEENHRSTQGILDAAYRLIQNNNPDRLEIQAGICKRLRSTRGPGRPPEPRIFETIDDESDFVAETIRERSQREQRRLADFAILVRANSQASPFLRALNVARTPWRFTGSRGLYDQEEVRAAAALLRVVADPSDNASLHFLAASSFYGVDAEALARATALASRANRTLLEVLRAPREELLIPGDSGTSSAVVRRLVADVSELLGAATHERTGEVLYRFLSERTGTLERLSASPQPADAMRLQNLARLFSIAERFGEVARYDRVTWFVDYLDSLIEAGDNPPVGDALLDADAVQILTVHQAKGLEFGVVFLVGLVAGRFPSIQRSDPIPLPAELAKGPLPTQDTHLREERRLFYVGMTRARDDLYLTSATDVGGTRARTPRLFVGAARALEAEQLRPTPGDPLAPVRRRGRAIAAKTVAPSGAAPGEPTSLSFRQVDDYLTCPQRYRYVHILRVPVRPHHAMVYGNAVHQAIRAYHIGRLAGEVVPLDVLHAVFRRHWRAEGFLTRQHEELRLQEGLEALRAFHAFEFEEGVVPLYVEKRFSIVDEGVRLVGVFDRIDRIDGEGRIIDYKTSAPLDREQAERRAKDSLQLAIYALAYRQMTGELPNAMELRFLTPEVVRGATVPTEKGIAAARRDIARVTAGLRDGAFPAEPAYQACRFCPYAAICPDRRLEGSA
ncbi:MAG: ATP-dependent DNA helicase [Candidatus Bipolaricaulota bacterium]